MTTDNLTWLNAKNSIVLGLGALFLFLLGLLVRGQWATLAGVSELRKDLAVLAVDSARDRKTQEDHENRIRALEAARRK